jgi:hypothetical protein
MAGYPAAVLALRGCTAVLALRGCTAAAVASNSLIALIDASRNYWGDTNILALL